MDIKAFGLGRIIAVGVIILTIVLAVIGRVDTVTAGLVGATALAIVLQ